MRRQGLLAVVVILVGGVACAGEEPFVVRVLSPAQRVPLGIPAVVEVEVRNASGAAVPVAFNRPPVAVLVEGEEGRWVHCEFCRTRWGVVRGVLPAAWEHHEIQTVPLESPGRYTVRGVLKHHWNIETKPRKFPDLWWGEAVSEPVMVEIVEPEGVDREAFEAAGGDPLHLWPSHHGKRLSEAELLRRFPTSTYAGYVVWKLLVRGVANNPVELLVKDLRNPLASQSNSVPCDIPDYCDSNDWMSLQGEFFLRWRSKWFTRILDHHPDIWFADEIRLKLALDRYLLGDRDGCETLLEELAAKGRPYVAAKARELLSAMRAKGMLPGGAAGGGS